MDLITLIAVAFGLAMDAFAVSVTSGFKIQNLQLRHALRIAFFFGVFQAGMPILGWASGMTIQAAVSRIGPWLAFGLLCLIGGKMIFESGKLRHGTIKKDPLKTSFLLILSIATSIDAFAVGISLACLKVAIVTPVIIIGLVTFILCFIGVYIGEHFGHVLEDRIEFIGGLILIGVGIKILVEQLL